MSLDIKIDCKFSNQELNDIWSALTIFERDLKKRKDSPITLKDVQKLIKKIRKYLK